MLLHQRGHRALPSLASQPRPANSLPCPRPLAEGLTPGPSLQGGAGQLGQGTPPSWLPHSCLGSASGELPTPTGSDPHVRELQQTSSPLLVSPTNPFLPSRLIRVAAPTRFGRQQVAQGQRSPHALPGPAESSQSRPAAILTRQSGRRSTSSRWGAPGSCRRGPGCECAQAAGGARCRWRRAGRGSPAAAGQGRRRRGARRARRGTRAPGSRAQRWARRARRPPGRPRPAPARRGTSWPGPRCPAGRPAGGPRPSAFSRPWEGRWPRPWPGRARRGRPGGGTRSCGEVGRRGAVRAAAAASRAAGPLPAPPGRGGRGREGAVAAGGSRVLASPAPGRTPRPQPTLAYGAPEAESRLRSPAWSVPPPYAPTCWVRPFSLHLLGPARSICSVRPIPRSSLRPACAHLLGLQEAPSQVRKEGAGSAGAGTRN